MWNNVKEGKTKGTSGSENGILSKTLLNVAVEIFT